MTTEQILHERSGSSCELCSGKENLQIYEVPPVKKDADHSMLICSTCHDQITGAAPMNANHWRCLNNSMWSEVPAIKAIAWRLLTKLSEGWSQDLLDMLYLEDETLAWARAGMEEEDAHTEDTVVHKDSNGTVLQSGDTVILIKDLDVKGGGFTAKRGTAVRGISLVENNPAQIEGRVNGQQIVILTQYVKKSN